MLCNGTPWTNGQKEGQTDGRTDGLLRNSFYYMRDWVSHDLFELLCRVANGLRPLDTSGLCPEVGGYLRA